MSQQAKLKKYVSHPFQGERYHTEVWNAVTTAVCAHYDGLGINPLTVAGDPQLDAIRASYRNAHYQVTRKQPDMADDPMGDDMHYTFRFQYRQPYVNQHGYWFGKLGEDTCSHIEPFYILSDSEMFMLYKAYVLLQAFLVWRSGKLHTPDYAGHFPCNEDELQASYAQFRQSKASTAYIQPQCLEGITNDT